MMEFDINLLITLVESKPVLWDPTCKVYKYKNKTLEAWKQIFILLKNDYEDMTSEDQNKFGKYVIKMWSTIYDAFEKYKDKKRDATRSKPVLTITAKHEYEDQLQFLNKIIDASETEDSSSEEVYTAKHEYEDQLQFLNKIIDASETEDSSSEEVQTCPNVEVVIVPVQQNSNKLVKLNPRKRKLDEFEIKMLQALEEKPQNPHLSFFKSTLPYLQEFNNDEILQFQMAVLQAVYTIKQRKVRHSMP